ncbi:HAD hydrolase-like protein [Schleiferilactobacillus harbinensis]|uniref:HAD hydrolase-like protein n=1 Tax=Schleiferilactobacillus harbinensis TaxID=304207 RepID=UPI0024323921|nr:HAD hydrolase-like protein [Schleiferilactobacillus harbinensis]MCI1687691.1 HAD hydrolase-like protein [Schleiferilactobacillus harbinensis]MCI1783395.1 HAD hydrolase-like protein [Schleiferilactobacillus harbinensis]MCI1849746.1 HAD hydrolase-like protein [Schleiferilactobacillus harbinensis]
MTQLFFDFDGTIANSEQGIVAGIKYFVKKMQLTPLTNDQYRLFIGPTLSASMHQFYPTLDNTAVKQAIDLYQEYYADQGIFEMQIYPGVIPVLQQLHAAGFTMNVASTKPEAMIDRIVQHFDLNPYFSGLYGATMDESIRSSKTDVLAYALKEADAAASNSIMIGDRNTDMIGGRANGVPTIGVLYGFGDRSELSAAGADVIVSQPRDIPAGIEEILVGSVK